MPAALHDAVRIYVIAGVNVIAADGEAEAQRQLELRRRAVARVIFSRPGRRLDDDQVDAVLASPQAGQVDQMRSCTAVGAPDAVRAYLAAFRRHADADELMTVHQADTVDRRLRSLEIVAATAGAAAA